VLAAIGLTQPAMGSSFEGRWLELREPADHRARSTALTVSLNQWLQRSHARFTDGLPQAPVTMVDLGTGRGSNAVYLSPLLQVPQHWLLLDQDACLLAETQARLTERGIAATVAEQRLSVESLPTKMPEHTTLITASALIDLVSAPWLMTLAETARARGAAVLVVLSYSGEFSLDPMHPDDGRVLALVNEHQRGEKGTGHALGPEAAKALEQRLQAAGYQVETQASPWHLDCDDAALIRELLDGWVAAASELILESRNQDGAWLQHWLANRLEQLAEERLAVTVQHVDLLALPEDG